MSSACSTVREFRLKNWRSGRRPFRIHARFGASLQVTIICFVARLRVSGLILPFRNCLGLNERLSAATADQYYDTIEAKIATPEFLPRTLYERFKIEVLGDDGFAA